MAEIRELEASQTASRLRLENLFQSMLHRAFAGELSLPEEAEVISPPESKAATPPFRRPNRHFARAVLSAEIVHRLHAEPTFGRIKHQKVFHLCEHLAEIEEIAGEYHREAAGPLDNRLIYANEAELKRQKWYAASKRGDFGHAYQPLEKAGTHRDYLERFWPEKITIIESLITVMRSWDTERCEIFSTTYAAWNDLIIWKRQVTDDAIIHEVLERWHESKRRITEDRWRKAIAWMQGKNFVPTGFGKSTSQPG